MARGRRMIRASGYRPWFLAALVALGCRSVPDEEKSAQQLVKEQTPTVQRLASYREEERLEAVNRFLALGKDRGSEVVFWFLQDDAATEDERLRVNLAGILAMWRDPRGIPYLLDLLNSEDQGVLRIAEEGLKNYGDHPLLAEKLADVLDGNANPATRKIVAGVLSHMRTHRAVEILGDHLRDPSEDVRVQCVFGIIDGPRSRTRTGRLVDALTDPDVEIRRLAWGALQEEKNQPPVSFDPAGTELERAEAVAFLRRWAGGRRISGR